MEHYACTILHIWISGGPVMIPLVLIALAIFGLASHLLWIVRGHGNGRHGDAQLRQWVRDPDQSRGEVGAILRYTQQQASSLDEIHNRYSEVMHAQLPVIERRLTVLTVMVSAAPLLGLLGTVFGMLTTFEAISSSTGKTVDLVAQGISEALITTETGLLIALPGYFMAHIIRRKKDEYAAFLTRLESFSFLQFQRQPP